MNLLAKLAGFARSFLRKGRAAPESRTAPAPSLPIRPARYVRVHPKLAALIGVALRGWTPRFASASPRRARVPGVQSEQERARRRRQLAKGMIRLGDWYSQRQLAGVR